MTWLVQNPLSRCGCLYEMKAEKTPVWVEAEPESELLAKELVARQKV